MKAKRKQLLEIQAGLRGISSVKVSESAWEIVRNLKTVTNILEEQDELYKTLYESCMDKDEQGNPVKYKEKSADGSEVEVTKISDPDQIKRHADFFRSMMEEEHEVTLTQVSKNAFKKAISKGELDLNYLVPLLDVMIPDDVKPVEQPKDGE
jgi:hypothetical protein